MLNKVLATDDKLLTRSSINDHNDQVITEIDKELSILHNGNKIEYKEIHSSRTLVHVREGHSLNKKADGTNDQEQELRFKGNDITTYINDGFPEKTKDGKKQHTVKHWINIIADKGFGKSSLKYEITHSLGSPGESNVIFHLNMYNPAQLNKANLDRFFSSIESKASELIHTDTKIIIILDTIDITINNEIGLKQELFNKINDLMNLNTNTFLISMTRPDALPSNDPTENSDMVSSTLYKDRSNDIANLTLAGFTPEELKNDVLRKYFIAYTGKEPRKNDIDQILRSDLQDLLKCPFWIRMLFETYDALDNSRDAILDRYQLFEAYTNKVIKKVRSIGTPLNISQQRYDFVLSIAHNMVSSGNTIIPVQSLGNNETVYESLVSDGVLRYIDEEKQFLTFQHDIFIYHYAAKYYLSLSKNERTEAINDLVRKIYHDKDINLLYKETLVELAVSLNFERKKDEHKDKHHELRSLLNTLVGDRKKAKKRIAEIDLSFPDHRSEDLAANILCRLPMSHSSNNNKRTNFETKFFNDHFQVLFPKICTYKNASQASSDRNGFFMEHAMKWMKMEAETSADPVHLDSTLKNQIFLLASHIHQNSEKYIEKYIDKLFTYKENTAQFFFYTHVLNILTNNLAIYSSRALSEHIIDKIISNVELYAEEKLPIDLYSIIYGLSRLSPNNEHIFKHVMNKLLSCKEHTNNFFAPTYIDIARSFFPNAPALVYYLIDSMPISIEKESIHTMFQLIHAVIEDCPINEEFFNKCKEMVIVKGFSSVQTFQMYTEIENIAEYLSRAFNQQDHTISTLSQNSISSNDITIPSAMPSHKLSNKYHTPRQALTKQIKEPSKEEKIVQAYLSSIENQLSAHYSISSINEASKKIIDKKGTLFDRCLLVLSSPDHILSEGQQALLLSIMHSISHTITRNNPKRLMKCFSIMSNFDNRVAENIAEIIQILSLKLSIDKNDLLATCLGQLNIYKDNRAISNSLLIASQHIIERTAHTNSAHFKSIIKLARTREMQMDFGIFIGITGLIRVFLKKTTSQGSDIKTILLEIISLHKALQKDYDPSNRSLNNPLYVFDRAIMHTLCSWIENCNSKFNFNDVFNDLHTDKALYDPIIIDALLYSNLSEANMNKLLNKYSIPRDKKIESLLKHQRVRDNQRKARIFRDIGRNHNKIDTSIFINIFNAIKDGISFRKYKLKNIADTELNDFIKCLDHFDRKDAGTFEDFMNTNGITMNNVKSLIKIISLVPFNNKIVNTINNFIEQYIEYLKEASRDAEAQDIFECLKKIKAPISK